MTTILNVGDYLYRNVFGIERYVINRATPKYAFIGGNKFPREVNGTTIRKIGADRWDAPWYVETQSFIDRYNLQLLVSKFDDIKGNTLSLDTLKQVLNIIGLQTKKEEQ